MKFNIAHLKALAQMIVTNTAAVHYEWVTTESHLSKIMADIKSTQFPLLVVVTPSYNVDSQDHDNAKDISQMLFFVLTRNNFQSNKPAIEASNADATLEIVNKIQEYLLNGFPDHPDSCIFPAATDPGSISIDPEWNYLGCDGWSLSFQIKY